MQHYWGEFIPLMLVFLLALVSPGADFVLVIRQAVVHGRKSALASTLGIAVGLVVHVSYTIFGLGLVIAKSVLLFNLIKWAGVAYLIFIGIKALKNQGGGYNAVAAAGDDRQCAEQSLLRAFMLGVAVNLLNPKAVLFFLSIFSTLVAPTTASGVQFVYGFTLISLAVGWFTGVSFFMTVSSIARAFSRASNWIDRVTGLVFIGLGVRLMFQKIS